MGAGKSKSFPISVDEAYRRVPQETLERLRETFRRLSTASGYLPQATFVRDVLGETVPSKLTDAIYFAFGGSGKGLQYRDLVCGLALLVHGSRQEKAKFVSLLVSEDGASVMKEHLEALIFACDGRPALADLSDLFGDSDCAALDKFESWILQNVELSSFTEWLLGEGKEGQGLQLEAEPDPPTFYQTLSKTFQLSEKEIMDIEKTYWGLKGGSGKFDEEVFGPYVSPPVPSDLVSDLFQVVDVNQDGHIDLTEMIQLIATCCKKEEIEGQKFCFQVFDSDRDGLLSRQELTRATQVLHTIETENADEGEVKGEGVGEGEEISGGESQRDDSAKAENPEQIAQSALRNFSNKHEGYLTEEEYIQWASSVGSLSTLLLSVMFEVCHVRFGLRPQSLSDEAKVVRGYMKRFKKGGRRHGDVVYLITASWFNKWKVHTSYENGAGAVSNGPSLTHKKSKRKKKKVKGHHQGSSSMSLCPPSTSQPTHTDVIEHGDDVLEVINVEMGSPFAVTGSETIPEEQDDSAKMPPIDNSELCVQEPSSSKKLPSLTNEGGQILRTKVLIENIHYVLLPEVIWKIFVTWYGNAGYSPLALPRTIRENREVELYPITFKIYRHTTVPPPVKQSSLPWPLPAILTSMGFMGSTSSQAPPPAPLIGAGAGGPASDGGQPIIPRRVLYYQAAFDKPTTIKEVMDRMCQILHTKAEDLRIHNFVDEEHPELLEDEEKTIDELGFSENHKLLIETRNRDNSWPEEIIAVMHELQTKDHTPSSPPTHEGRVTPGATGLSNLGNTCFMNSALQCVSNAQPLTRYFLEKDHLLEINKDNPLGMGGVMAKRYSDLINDLWSGNSKSITPLKFRFTVGRCAPQFNGFQQQDAQELLAFVLDGLHEDLNRVKEKAYRELNDSDGRPDEVVASEAWDYHLSRNQSIVVDLFHGQLKSVVTCKVCGYSSVRFDPFTFLSLPLPLDSTFNLEVIVMRLDGSQPVRYGIKMELDDKYRRLKEIVSDLCGIPSSNLRLAEVYGAMLKSLPADTTKIRSVLGGYLYAFEIPPPPPVRPTSRSDSPDEVQRKLKKIKIERERTLSLKGAHEERVKAQRAREKVARMKQEQQPSEETEGEPQIISMEVEEADDSDQHDGLAQISDTEGDHIPNPSTGPIPFQEPAGMEESDGFVFAIHRRTYSVDHYFTRHQKTRLLLFGVPLVVPCVAMTTGEELYAGVWSQVKRLIIPDPPAPRSPSLTEESERSHSESQHQYPFELKKINKDGVSCSQCPWYRFCRGCPVVCDANSVGRTSGYIALDWDQTTLQLKYQSALERPVDHESMESLKIIDTKPIDLYDCFKAFVREDELGDEESWYCKQCKRHQEATKSLEIWRLPPILIIHLKRFQFFNGRWVKSQRSVSFPTLSLEPLRYTVENGNGTTQSQNQNGPMQVEDIELKEPSLKRQLTPPTDMESQQPPAKRSVPEGEGEGGEVTMIEEASDGSQEPVEVNGAAGEDGEDGDAREPGEDGDAREAGEDGDTREDGQPTSVEVTETDELLPNNLPKIYDLFATCCHSGVMGGGHYVSFAKNTNGKWHYYNDSACKETTEERMVQESPYMLFYQLQGLDNYFDKFRASKHGKRQELGSTDDDREFEETLKSLRKACVIQ